MAVDDNDDDEDEDDDVLNRAAAVCYAISSIHHYCSHFRVGT